MNCITCNITFDRPAEYHEWAKDNKFERLKIFYSDKLKYCDDCGRKRIEKALERLPEILEALI